MTARYVSSTHCDTGDRLEFALGALTLAEVGQLLWAAQGVNHAPFESWKKRAFPLGRTFIVRAPSKAASPKSRHPL